jgi:hypothetical protein
MDKGLGKSTKCQHPSTRENPKSKIQRVYDSAMEEMDKMDEVDEVDEVDERNIER